MIRIVPVPVLAAVLVVALTGGSPVLGGADGTAVARRRLTSLMADHPGFSVPVHPSDFRTVREREIHLRFLESKAMRDFARRAARCIADDGERQLVRGAVAVGPDQFPELDGVLVELADRFGLRRENLGLYVFGEREYVASTWGWSGRRPVLAFASSLLEDMPADRLRFFLAYELAHVAAGHVELKTLCAVLSAVDDTVRRELHSLEKEAYEGVREELKRRRIDVTGENFWADLLHVSRGALDFLPVAAVSKEIIKGVIALVKQVLHHRITGFLGLWRIDADRSACRAAYLEALLDEGDEARARSRVVRALLSLMLASPDLADRVNVDAFLAQMDRTLNDPDAEELVFLGEIAEGEGRLARLRGTLTRLLDEKIRAFFDLRLCAGVACDNVVAVLRDLFLFAESGQCRDFREFHETRDELLRALHVLARAQAEYEEACASLNGRQDECAAFRDLLARAMAVLFEGRLLDGGPEDEAWRSLIRRSGLAAREDRAGMADPPETMGEGGADTAGDAGADSGPSLRLLAKVARTIRRRGTAEGQRALEALRGRLDDGRLGRQTGYVGSLLRETWPDLPSRGHGAR